MIFRYLYDDYNELFGFQAKQYNGVVLYINMSSMLGNMMPVRKHEQDKEQI